MTNKEIEHEIEKILESQDIFKLNSVQYVNHKPHQFMIGPKHIAHASDHHGGMLGDATLEKIHCAHPGCKMMYKDHTFDKIVFLSLLRNAGQDESRTVLMSILEIKEYSLDGVAFVETSEMYRIS